MNILQILLLLLAQEGKVFPVQGTDLLQGAEVSSATKVGKGNYRLEKGGKLIIPVIDKMQSGSYQVKVHILPLANGPILDFRKLVNDKPFSWPIELRDGKWLVKTGDGKELTVDAKIGEWVDVVFEVFDESKTIKGVTESSRALNISVDGKVILQHGQHTGKLTNFAITAGEGSMVIGGVDLVAPTKIRK